ncbi:MAG: hypothetical protein Q4G33_12875 [bacterium]|nr:hypothetical protein [bacterium]
MNMKKFISLMSATAMVSSLVVVPMSVHAEGETVIWSDTFNTYAVPEETYQDWLAGILISGAGKDGEIYSGIPGIGLKVGSRSGGDDSTYWTLNEKADNAEDKYLVTATGRFSTASRGGKLIFDEPQTATADKDIVLAFDVAGINCRDSGVTYDKAFAVYGNDGNTVINLDTAGLMGVEWDSRAAIDENYWATLKVVVSTSGTKVFYEDTEVASSSATTITGLDFSVYIGGAAAASGSEYRIDGNGRGYPAYAFDNVIMYSTAAGAGEASTIPEVTDNTSTPQPTHTPPPPAAEITETTTVDFDDNTLEKAGITVTSHADYATVNEASKDVSDTNAMSVAQTSEKDNSYSYATLDLSAITEGKSHVIVDYDLYVEDSGRLKVILQDGALSGSKATELSGGLINQGITSSSAAPAVVKGAWAHTTVDVDFASGTGTYAVTKLDDGSEVASGSITTDLTAVTTMSLVSWSPNTSYIDNLVIKTGGEMEGPTLATPEPASTVEGSGVDLMPTDALYVGDLTEASTGNDVAKLNHTQAQAIVSKEGINAYTTKARGKSIFAAYDVYLTPGSSTSIIATGDEGKAISSTMKLTTNKDSTVTVSADTNKGTVTAEQKLVADTWYRVLVEVPQSGTAEATTTDSLTYTIYRINADDPSQVTEIAAQLKELSARGLATKGVTAFNLSADGDVYFDNSSVFAYTTGYSYLSEPAAEVTPEPAGTEEGSDITLVPDGVASSDLSAAEGDPTKILNHSSAKPVVDAANIDAYFDKARGKSVYVAYDALVEKGSSISLIAHGDSGKAAGPTLQLTADDNGAVTVSAVTGSDKTETAKQTLAAGTWYRIVAEFPQTGTAEATSTGNVTYTVYRIDGSDPTKTIGVAAQLKDLSARGLANKSTSSMELTSTGTAYIDNGVVYLDATTEPEVVTYTKYTATYADDGRLTNVTMEAIDNPTADDVVLTGTTKTFVWASTGEPFVG